MPPRHTKSEFASYLLPAWFLGKYPHKKSHPDLRTQRSLAAGFGRKVRNLVDQEHLSRLYFRGLGYEADSKGRRALGTLTRVETTSLSV
jgi:hypothetical protein